MTTVLWATSMSINGHVGLKDWKIRYQLAKIHNNKIPQSHGDENNQSKPRGTAIGVVECRECLVR